jgi:hypothetical protein
MTKLSPKTALPVLALVFALVACSLGGTGSSQPGEVNGAVPGPTDASSGSGGSSSSSGYGSVPVPTDTVDLKAGQVYKIGQAVKDPSSEAIFEVIGVRKDSSLPGLSSGETYLMVDILLGNAGTQTFTSSSLGSYVVRAKSDGKVYGEGHILALLAAKAIPSNAGMDVDVAPGTADHGILPVVLSASATGLTITFTPAGSTAMGNPFTVDLGQ